jgi:hypothetical protein
VKAITSKNLSFLDVGLVTNNFEPTRLLQVSQAERPVVEEYEIAPVLVVKVHLALVANVSPTLTVRPMPSVSQMSLAENNTVLTMADGVRVIVKLQVALFGDVCKRYPYQLQPDSKRVMTPSVAQAVYDVPQAVEL